jgi:thiol-disulfide isomerase/thioredoxin
LPCICSETGVGYGGTINHQSSWASIPEINIGKSYQNSNNSSLSGYSVFLLRRFSVMLHADVNFMIGKKAQQAIIIAVIALCFTSTALSNTPEPLIGKTAPLLSGKNVLGSGLLKLTNLMTEVAFDRDEKGKFKEVDGKYVMQIKKNVVVLNFFATTCIPCIREIPNFNRLVQNYKNKPVKFIYVNVDTEVSPQKIARFIAKRRIKVPMMMPNQKDAIKKYQVYSLPRIVIIDRQKKIAHEIRGFKEDLNEQLTLLVDDLL